MDEIINPDHPQLIHSLTRLAHAIGVKQPIEAQLRSVVDYVLFDHELDGDGGRRSIAAFQQGLLTEREVRQLMIHHGWMSLTYWHGIRDAPAICDEALKTICESIEYALFGRLAVRMPHERPDPWETDFKGWDYYMREQDEWLRNPEDAEPPDAPKDRASRFDNGKSTAGPR